MDLSRLRELIDNRYLLSSGSAIIGAIMTRLVAVLRGRVKVIEYTVSHDRVALSAEDALFGNVQVTWHGTPVVNLYMSTVEIRNDTTRDFADLTFRVYTGDTLLLTEKADIPGSVYLPSYTPAFARSIEVAPGQQPTDQQFNTFRHNREYAVRVLNRGQRVVLRYLTSMPVATSSPSVWVDIAHPGVTIVFRPSLPAIHGVAVKLALPIGLLVCMATIVLVGSMVHNIWMAACLAMFVGLIAQSIGALAYRGARSLWRLMAR